MQIKDPFTLAELKEITEQIKQQAETAIPRNEKFCAFIGNTDKWNKFCKKNKRKIQYFTKTWVEFRNGERWCFYDDSKADTLNLMGCRFYKVKADTYTDKFFFRKVFLPCCLNYCIEIEWV